MLEEGKEWTMSWMMYSQKHLSPSLPFDFEEFSIIYMPGINFSEVKSSIWGIDQRKHAILELKSPMEDSLSGIGYI